MTMIAEHHAQHVGIHRMIRTAVKVFNDRASSPVARGCLRGQHPLGHRIFALPAFLVRLTDPSADLRARQHINTFYTRGLVEEHDVQYISGRLYRWEDDPIERRLALGREEIGYRLRG
jgi:hypothetical protein